MWTSQRWMNPLGKSLSLGESKMNPLFFNISTWCSPMRFVYIYIYTFMHCITLHYISLHGIGIGITLHSIPYHTDVTPLKHHRFSQVPVTRSAQVTFVQAGRGEDSLRVRWCRFLKCCRTPPVGRWFPSSTSSRKRCVMVRRTVAASKRRPSYVQATSSVWTVRTSSLDDLSCRMLGFFIHSIQRRAVICPTTCAAVSTSTSLRAEPLSLFDVCGKAKELYQQLPDWVRPGSVATCLAFELPGSIESIGFSTTKASAFLVHDIGILKVQLWRRGDSTSNCFPRRIGGQRASIACCLCRSEMFVPERARLESFWRLLRQMWDHCQRCKAIHEDSEFIASSCFVLPVTAYLHTQGEGRLRFQQECHLFCMFYFSNQLRNPDKCF